jgi:enoyl-CoA hydratase/carnithine racemase
MGRPPATGRSYRPAMAKVDLEHRGAVGVIPLNRPETRNAFQNIIHSQELVAGVASLAKRK